MTLSRLSDILKRNLLPALAICIMMAGLSGCRSGKSASQSQSRPSEQATGYSGREAFAAMASAWKPWTDVKVPFSASISSAKLNQRASGTLTMERGKSIDLSLRYLGFEIARLVVIDDSAHILFKPGKRMLSKSLKSLLGNEATIADLQDLLLGRLGFTNNANGIPSSSDFKISHPEGWPADTWLAAPAKEGAHAFLQFVFSAAALEGAVVGTDLAPDRVTIEYGPSVTTPVGNIAESFKATTVASKFEASLKCEFTAGKAQWNKGNKVKWKRPSGTKMVNSLKNLFG